jgi:hypothetical protein
MFNNIKTTTDGAVLDGLYNPAQDNAANLNTPQQLPQPPMPEGTLAYSVPSRGVFYGGITTVEVAPLTIGQVVDVESVYSGKTVYEQFSKFVSIVNQSVYGVNVLDLTVQDFYAVCYYLRLISYKNEPIMIQVEFDINGQMRKLSTPIYADSISVKSMQDIVPNNELQLDYIRVRDYLFTMQQEESDKLNKWEKLYFAYVAGDTPEQKLANFRALRADKFAFLLKHQVDSYHGVDKLIKVKSPTGEVVEMEVDFDYSMFFPSIIQQAFYGNDI